MSNNCKFISESLTKIFICLYNSRKASTFADRTFGKNNIINGCYQN